MAVLLIAELSNSELAEDATAKALTAAKKMGDVTILCAGENTENAAKSAAKLSGVAKVLYAESSSLGHDLAEPVSDLIISLSDKFSHTNLFWLLRFVLIFLPPPLNQIELIGY